MQIIADTPEAYLDLLPEDRKPVIGKLRSVLLENLPPGFAEVINYGMIGYVVPHSLFPAGYHCDPKQPLPFINLASQKNFVALYHMGLYADPELMKWFTEEYPRHCQAKLDMGKSCIRFKKPDQVPYELVGELAARVSPQDWINTYKAVFKR
ncbi:MAG: DUF1801 domain-containing protein [Adhaeribacter sp.]